MTVSTSPKFGFAYSDGEDTFDYDKFIKENFQKVDEKAAFNGTVTSVDLNSLDATGFYICTGAMTNSPFTTGVAFYLQHLKNDNGNKKQIAYDISSDRVFSRTQYSGAWTAWTTSIQSTGITRMDVVSGLFFTNGGSNVASSTITFNKPFTSIPYIAPMQLSNVVSYADVIYYPYIFNITTTGFQCKITSTGNLGSSTPTNLVVSFLVVGY
jgi:hypothetical protein